MKFVAVFLLCLLAHNTNGNWESGRKCGEKLAEIMWLVCDKKNFNSMMDKRSDTLIAEQPAHELDTPYPYAPTSLANIFQVDAGNLLTKTRRLRLAGIADECCKKPCTISELRTYCI